ncbi:MAG: hypothetical protein Q4G06_01990 [Clostridia bacterium]|nr:hypothetical protein [Clostridia bacterium]
MRRGILVLLCLLLMCGSCAAEEAVNRALDAADLSGLEEFAGDAAPELDLQQVVLDAAQGELTTADELLEQLRNRVLDALREALRACGALIAPALLLATLRCALPEGNGGSEGARFLLLCVLMLSMMRLVLGGMEGVEACMRRVGGFADAVAPPLAALMTAAGMTNGAALLSPMATLVGGAVENWLLKYGLPLCRYALALAVAGNLSEAIDLTRACRLMRKAANWGAGLAVTLFTALTAIQGTVISGMDGVAVRTAKYAVDSVTSVIGSGVSDAWDSYVAGILIAKNAVGVSGVVLLLALGLQPMLRTAAAMLMLNLFSALMDMLGERRAANAAEQAAGVCQMLLMLCAAALTLGMILLGAAMAAGRTLLG